MKTTILSLIISTLTPPPFGGGKANVVHAQTCTSDFKTIGEIFAGETDDQTIGSALFLTGLNDALSTKGPFTVFAPTDRAFDALPNGELDALFADPEALSDILSYHVLSGEFNYEEVAALIGTEIKTVKRATVAVGGTSNNVVLNGVATFVIKDIMACNGIIHFIDAVLLPPSAPSKTPTLKPTEMPEYCSDKNTIVEIFAGKTNFQTLSVALSLTGLNDTLRTEGPFTVFAPTDRAFDALPNGELDALIADPEALADILTYHVLSGEFNSEEVAALIGTEIPTVNGATVAVGGTSKNVVLNGVATFVNNDIMACNGIIHVIDAVLLPPSAPSKTPTGKPTEMPEYCSATIVEVAAGVGTFQTLGVALSLTGLNDTLSNEGPFTVFAPTDKAFAALPDGRLDALIADPEALADILTYHVLSGEVNYEEVVALAGTEIETVNGATVAVGGTSKNVVLNGVATFVKKDIMACNGIIHVIDTVLLPPSAPSATPSITKSSKKNKNGKESKTPKKNSKFGTTEPPKKKATEKNSKFGTTEPPKKKAKA